MPEYFYYVNGKALPCFDDMVLLRKLLKRLFGQREYPPLRPVRVPSRRTVNDPPARGSNGGGGTRDP